MQDTKLLLDSTQDGDLSLSCEVLPYDASLWPSLREDWSRLVLVPELGSAFTSVPWVDIWMDVYGEQLRPTGVRWRTGDGSTVACALLPTESVKLGRFSVRRMYLNASGTDGAFCEHNDILADPSHRAAVLQDLVRIVLDSGIDELSLAGFRERAADDIKALWPGEPWSGFMSEAPFVALDSIREDGVEYLSRLSRNTRSQVRRSLRRYTERYGDAHIERAASEAQAIEWFNEMVELHQAHWQSRGEPGAFSDDARQFHQRLISHCYQAPAQGLNTAMFRVQFGTTTVGLLYFLEFSGRTNFYQSGLLYDDDVKLKPGLVAHTLAVQHYVESTEFAEYDFLGGDPHTARYKQSLSTDKRLLAWQELPVPSFRVNSIGKMRRLRRWFRSRYSRGR